MPHHWPSEPPLVRWGLDVVDRGCHVCGRYMHVCDHRRHPIYTLQGPRLLVNRLVHCVDPDCAGHHRTVSPEAEAGIALPRSISRRDTNVTFMDTNMPVCGLCKKARPWFTP